MKFFIACFYQIRFFKKNQIPISTAAFDPKFFKCNNKIRKDARGIYLGLNSKKLNSSNVPSDSQICPCIERKPAECKFLKGYMSYLRSLNFSKTISDLEAVANAAKMHDGYNEEPEVILMVYEKPDNPCSERVILKRWFNENGMLLDDYIEDHKHG